MGRIIFLLLSGLPAVATGIQVQETAVGGSSRLEAVADANVDAAADAFAFADAFADAFVDEGAESAMEEVAVFDERTTAGSCDCLSWAEVYATKKAWCGRANELYFLSKNGFSAAYAATEPITGLPHKVCYDFFKNFLSPKCVNVDLYPFPANGMTGKQWCYVSNDCPDLNGGGAATNAQGFAQTSWHNLQSATTQAWKICDTTAAESLASMSVSELTAMGLYSDVPLSRMMRLALPVSNISWGEARYLWTNINANYASDKSITEMVDAVPSIDDTWGASYAATYAILKDLAKSEKPTILDSAGHGDNFYIVEGRAVYFVGRVALGNMAYLGGHFGKEFAVECVMGCADAESREEVDMMTL